MRSPFSLPSLMWMISLSKVSALPALPPHLDHEPSESSELHFRNVDAPHLEPRGTIADFISSLKNSPVWSSILHDVFGSHSTTSSQYQLAYTSAPTTSRSYQFSSTTATRVYRNHSSSAAYNVGPTAPYHSTTTSSPSRLTGVTNSSSSTATEVTIYGTRLDDDNRVTISGIYLSPWNTASNTQQSSASSVTVEVRPLWTDAVDIKSALLQYSVTGPGGPSYTGSLTKSKTSSRTSVASAGYLTVTSSPGNFSYHARNSTYPNSWITSISTFKSIPTGRAAAFTSALAKQVWCAPTSGPNIPTKGVPVDELRNETKSFCDKLNRDAAGSRTRCHDTHNSTSMLLSTTCGHTSYGYISENPSYHIKLNISITQGTAVNISHDDCLLAMNTIINTCPKDIASELNWGGGITGNKNSTHAAASFNITVMEPEDTRKSYTRDENVPKPVDLGRHEKRSADVGEQSRVEVFRKDDTFNIKRSAASGKNSPSVLLILAMSSLSAAMMVSALPFLSGVGLS